MCHFELTLVVLLLVVLLIGTGFALRNFGTVFAICQMGATNCHTVYIHKTIFSSGGIRPTNFITTCRGYAIRLMKYKGICVADYFPSVL